jgi:23S rRNA pseudouridine955/2504/2580 synthase
MKKSYDVDISYEGIRIDKWIRNNLGNVPQGLIEKSLRAGKIKINKKKIKSSTKLKNNDIINVYNIKFEEKFIQKNIKFKPSDETIKENENLIIDDNENFIVVNKESGIAVQGGTKSKKNLIDIFSKSKIFENSKPYSVHRLDKDTSGVFIIAKNRDTAKLFTSLFRLRKIHKTYLAICYGELEIDKGIFNQDLIRYDGDKKIIEKSKTTYKIIDKNSNCTLLEMNPITGRKHQLRKQLSLIGHPIYGDDKYTFEKKLKTKNKELMLHSYKIKFIINNKKYTFKALLPDYFKKLIKIKRLNFLN